MNIVNKLTLRHLGANKSRTVITTLGIIISVAMITAVFVSAASFMNLDGEINLLVNGRFHARFEEVSQEQLGALRRDDTIQEVGCTTTNEAENGFLLPESKTEYSGVGAIYAGDEENLKQMFTGQFEGTCPKNETEIAVEQSFLDDNGLDWKIGDRVELALGSRYIEEDGERFSVTGGWKYGEQFEKARDASFTITAILDENPATCRQYAAVRGMSDEEKGGLVAATVVFKKIDSGSLKALKALVKKYGIVHYTYNSDYYMSKLAIGKENTLVMGMLPMVLFILILIVVASVCLIYNAFGMSLSERVRYLGMLASVGATRRQKRGSVYFEGFILGAIGIPVGLAAGIIGIAVTLRLVGDKIIATGMLRGTKESGMQFATVVPVWCVIGIVIFSVLTIFISAYIPARKASRVTPIDALRQAKEIRVKAKKLRSPFYIRPLFGYEGELAHKSLKRNGRRSRVITASIALSLILFLCVNYFCTMFTQANDVSMMPYQMMVNVPYEQEEKLRADLEKIGEIDDVYSVAGLLRILESDDNMEESERLMDKELRTAPYQKSFEEKMVWQVLFADDADFDAICEKNGLDPKEYYGDTVKGVVMNNLNHNAADGDLFTDELLGQSLRADEENIELAGFVAYDAGNYLCNLTPHGYIEVLVPESQAYEKIAKGEGDYEGSSYWVQARLGIETDDREAVGEALDALVNEYGHNVLGWSDLMDQADVMNTVIFVLQVFIYGFIALITLITVANIMNTISTGVLLRRKEFAMLKSVGITPGGFRKMICLESLFYGLRAVVVGIPLSLLLNYLMNRSLGSDMLPFTVNIGLYVIAVAAVFVVIGLTMVFAVSKISKDSVVETLKEEIQ